MCQNLSMHGIDLSQHTGASIRWWRSCPISKIGEGRKVLAFARLRERAKRIGNYIVILGLVDRDDKNKTTSKQALKSLQGFRTRGSKSTMIFDLGKSDIDLSLCQIFKIIKIKLGLVQNYGQSAGISFRPNTPQSVI